MTNRNDFNLIFGILIGAMLGVIGNIMVTELYGGDFWGILISASGFFVMIVIFWYLLLKLR